jgi:hypothetical protein
MVISKTSAVDIKTHAVSPEFIFNTPFKKFFFQLSLEQGECQSKTRCLSL